MYLILREMIYTYCWIRPYNSAVSVYISQMKKTLWDKVRYNDMLYKEIDWELTE